CYARSTRERLSESTGNEINTSSRRLNRRIGSFRFSAFLSFAAQDRIQFAAEQEKETSEVHPGQQNNDRCEREISRVVAAVTRDIQLKQLRHRDPADGKKDRAGQGLPDREIIFGRQQVQNQRESDQGDRSKWQTQSRHPFLKRHFELKIYFRDAGQRFTKDNRVEANQNHDSEPEQEQ